MWSQFKRAEKREKLRIVASILLFVAGSIIMIFSDGIARWLGAAAMGPLIALLVGMVIAKMVCHLVGSCRVKLPTPTDVNKT